MKTECKGKISQIIGAVVDVTFDDGVTLPNIYDALVVKRPDGTEVIFECQQDIGENTMRTPWAPSSCLTHVPSLALSSPGETCAAGCSSP